MKIEEAAKKLGKAIRHAVDNHGAPNGFTLGELAAEYGGPSAMLAGRAWRAFPDVVRSEAGCGIEVKPGRVTVIADASAELDRSHILGIEGSRIVNERLREIAAAKRVGEVLDRVGK